MKKTIVFLLFLTVMVSLVGCSPSNTQISGNIEKSEPAVTDGVEGKNNAEKQDVGGIGTGKTIAFVPKQLGNPFFVAIKDSMEEAAIAEGYTFKCNAPDASTEVDKQINIAEAFIEEGVDALILGPCDSTALVDVINRAAEKDIAVFLVDSGADESDYVTYIGTNNYEGGKIAAKWMGENVKGQVAIVDGFSGNEATTQRYKGFMDEIKNYPDVDVVTSDYANGDLSMGMSVAENFLVAYPELVGIFAVDDMMAIGAGQAVEAAGKTDQVKVLGFDGQPDAAEKIIEGTIDATIAQKPATMGRMTVEFVTDYLNGKEVERVIDTGCDIVTINNAELYKQWQ